jgi:hypothetical protein
MINRLKHFLWDLRDRQRIAIALAKGGAMMQARTIDLRDPGSWEFSGFSQNGEDGILDVLRRQLRQANRYFVEIGAADGIQNNSAWLVVAERYSGLMVEGDPLLAERARRMMLQYSIGAECLSMFVRRDNASQLLSQAMHSDPDVFSLDIDGNDYYIADALMRAGLRPKICVVEYNSVFGPDRSCTVDYRDSFVFTSAHPTHLYYGVSVTGWRHFFARYGYRFIGVDQNGVNAFFVDPAHFDPAFLQGVKGSAFAENRYQWRKFRGGHAQQMKLIADEKLITIE